MPNLETPDELAEQIADWCGVWGGFPEEWQKGHENDCKCRMCFVGKVTYRIRESVKNEALLSAAQPQDVGGGE